MTPSFMTVAVAILTMIGFFLVMLALVALSYYMTTKDLTREEKEAFDKYLAENGLFGADDDWP